MISRQYVYFMCTTSEHYLDIISRDLDNIQTIVAHDAQRIKTIPEHYLDTT